MSKFALFQFKSLKTKLLVWFLLLGVFPAAIVGYAAYYKSKNTLTQLTERRVSLIAEEAMDKIDRVMSERFGDIQLFAGLPLAKFEPEKITKPMDDFVALYGVYDLMVLADADGQILAVNSKNPQGKPIPSQTLL